MRARTLMLSALAFSMALTSNTSLFSASPSGTYNGGGFGSVRGKGQKGNFTAKAKIKKAKRKQARRSRRINQINKRR